MCDCFNIMLALFIFHNATFLIFSAGNCKAIAQEIAGFNGCSVPDWMPKDLVNTHGKGLTNSLWKYWWSSSDKSEENYSQIFETDCNKHDICYGCVSKALKWIPYQISNRD